jgi:tRNA threonylcarbamoyladenosine biosynthesis protein TsaE
MELIYTIDQINDTAKRFWEAVEGKKVIALHGEMGAGKTTFVHALCDVLQVSSTVGSPSFSIINEYYFPGGKIFHMDLYRLKDEEEAARAGVEDSIYSGNICLVEWPDRAPGLFPDDTLHVSFSMLDNVTRKISFSL